MSDPKSPVTWRLHPGTGKWHAWAQGADASVCRYTRIGREESATLPVGVTACQLCGHALATPVPPPGPVRGEEVEVMRAEFRGGPFDGETIPLKVVRTSATTHRVLATDYTRTPSRSAVLDGLRQSKPR